MNQLNVPHQKFVKKYLKFTKKGNKIVESSTKEAIHVEIVSVESVDYPKLGKTTHRQNLLHL